MILTGGVEGRGSMCNGIFLNLHEASETLGHDF